MEGQAPEGGRQGPASRVREDLAPTLKFLSPVYSGDEPSAGSTLVSLLLKPLATIRLSHWRRFPWPLPPLQRKKKRPLLASQRITRRRSWSASSGWRKRRKPSPTTSA